jgi:hypothetical protein
MLERRVREWVAGLMTLVALGSIAYLAVIRNDEAAKGVLAAVLAAAVSWYLRGRVENPS